MNWQQDYTCITSLLEMQNHMAAILLFCQMMGLVIRFCSSITILYSFFFSFIMVYIHTDIQWEETSVLSLVFFFLSLSLSVSPRECFPQKRRAYGSKVKVLCCEISLEYSFILYIWCRHLSHLLGLSHLEEKRIRKSVSYQFVSVHRVTFHSPFNSCFGLHQLLKSVSVSLAGKFSSMVSS